MDEQTFPHFYQAFVNAMEERSMLRPKKGKAKCCHHVDDKPQVKAKQQPLAMKMLLNKMRIKLKK